MSLYRSKQLACSVAASILVLAGGGCGGSGESPRPEPSMMALLAGPSEYFFGYTAGVGLLTPPFEFEGIAVDPAGNLVVADAQNGTIRRISKAGIVATIAGDAEASRASIDGVGQDARFFRPSGLAIDSAGNIFASDIHCGYRPISTVKIPLPWPVCTGTIRRIAPDGTVTTIAGRQLGYSESGKDGVGGVASFALPLDLAIDRDGNLYVADQLGAAIHRIDPSGAVTTLAGVIGDHRIVDGENSSARFDCLTGIAVDSDGNVYVTDTPAIRIYPVMNPCLQYNAGPTTIRRVTPSGVVTTIDPGVEGSSYTARMVIDGAGSLYIADREHHVIRKRTPDGTVTPIVGRPGHRGYLPGPLPGTIESPRGVVLRGPELYFTLAYGVAFTYNPS